MLAPLRAALARAPDFIADHVVVGGGVVGLAVGEALTRAHLRLHKRSDTSTLVLESESKPGTGVSSRNSEVIHAGLYYPPGSLKSTSCIEGRRLLYDFCALHGVGHRRCGKWIVATTQDQVPQLKAIADTARKVGVPLHPLSKHQAAELPAVRLVAGLNSPTTGIVDSHGVMLALEGRIRSQNGDVVCGTRVVAIVRERLHNEPDIGMRVVTHDGSSFHARKVVLSAGLSAHELLRDGVAAFADTSIGDIPPLSDAQRNALSQLVSSSTTYPVKGYYYRLATSTPPVDRLVYPVPERNLRGLGIHCTVDLAGSVRLGPDAQYVDRADDVSADDDPNRHERFVNAVRAYLPNIDPARVCIDYAGLRPKLSPPDTPPRDFGLQLAPGFPSLAVLFGIESPGLTAALSLARRVSEIIDVPLTPAPWEQQVNIDVEDDRH